MRLTRIAEMTKGKKRYIIKAVREKKKNQPGLTIT